MAPENRLVLAKTALPTGSRSLRLRHFNPTHEWLSQLWMYAVCVVAGFPGIVLARAVLAALCALAGFLAARLAGKFYAGIAAACAAASVLVAFAADRPGVISFLGAGRSCLPAGDAARLLALPPLALVWANCHGGFLLGLATAAGLLCRKLAAGAAVLSNTLGRLLRHIDNECSAYIESETDYPLYARTLARYWRHNQVKHDGTSAGAGRRGRADATGPGYFWAAGRAIALPLPALEN